MKKNTFKFTATVSDRGQIFIPKALQDFFALESRDKVIFIVGIDGKVLFMKKGGKDDGQEKLQT